MSGRTFATETLKKETWSGHLSIKQGISKQELLLR